MGAARVFSLTTPFTVDELAEVGYEQTADVMILTHVNHPPQALRRYGHANWTINDAEFKSLTPAPVATGATPTVVTVGTPTTQTYAVTAIDADTGRESLISNEVSCNNDLGVDIANFNEIAWSASLNAATYNVYEKKNGLWGFIGGAASLTFKDDNIAPDQSDGPPGDTNPFTGANNYPARVTFHEQRAVFGRTNNKPTTVFGSGASDFFNMNVAQPAKASDAYTFGLVARQVNAIQHLVPLKALLVFTSGVVFSLVGPDGYLSPTSAKNTPENYRGSSRVRPAIVDQIAFYNTAKGNQVRTIGYEFQIDGYKGNDITVFAPHLFRNFTMVQMAWADAPTSALWTVRSDGKMPVLTWQAEQDVWGWSLCETQGGVEDVITVTEHGEDVPYFIVRRTIGVNTRRYVERLTTPNWGDDVADAVFMDAARSYVGDPATEFSGARHLAGMAVAVLGDGAVYDDITVSADGAFTLPEPCSKVHVGLAYEGWVHTLTIVSQVQGIGSTAGRMQTAAQVALALIKTRGIEIAPGKKLRKRDLDTSDASASGPFYPVKFRSDELMDNPPDVFTGDKLTDVSPGDWSEATVVIRQRQPLPFTLTGVFPDVEVGG